jgi:hypothetical protein
MQNIIANPFGFMAIKVFPLAYTSHIISIEAYSVAGKIGF